MANLLDSASFLDPSEAVDFIENVLEASTEYSIIGKDLDGNILLWNEGARRIYGYEAAEVVNRANSDILHVPDDVVAGLPLEMRATALSVGKWEGTVTRRRRDGTTFTARVVLTPRRNKLGDAVGFLLISKDISNDIRLTEELEATQFYTRSLIESNIDALMTTDPVGVITDVNQQMEWLTGRTREDLIGSPFKLYFTDQERAEDGVRQALREGKVTNYELTARAKDGRETVVSYNATTFNDRDGKLQGVFAAARDVTEHKRLEDQLRQSESYNRGLIEASVDGLVTVQPDGLISDVNAQMSRMSNNAIKFTPAGGVTLRLEVDRGAVRLHVSDTGIGIAPEDRERLFRAFEQVGETRGRPFEGTGLGLYISRKLAEVLGGSINLVSEPGVGSTFTVSLPRY